MLIFEPRLCCLTTSAVFHVVVTGRKIVNVIRVEERDKRRRDYASRLSQCEDCTQIENRSKVGTRRESRVMAQGPRRALQYASAAVHSLEKQAAA